MDGKRKNKNLNHQKGQLSKQRATMKTEKKNFLFSEEVVQMCLYGKRKMRNVSPTEVQNNKRKGCSQNDVEGRYTNKTSGENNKDSSHPNATKSLQQKLSHALESIPDEVELCTSSASDEYYGICAKRHLPAGTWIGPYEGIRVKIENLAPEIDKTFLWEIYKDGQLNHFIDGSDEDKSSWMRFIGCARYKEEQNLYAIQYDDNIFYRAFKDIAVGTEMLVWYDESYMQYMGIPLQWQETKLSTKEFQVQELRPIPVECIFPSVSPTEPIVIPQTIAVSPRTDKNFCGEPVISQTTAVSPRTLRNINEESVVPPTIAVSPRTPRNITGESTVSQTTTVSPRGAKNITAESSVLPTIAVPSRQTTSLSAELTIIPKSLPISRRTNKTFTGEPINSPPLAVSPRTADTFPAIQNLHSENFTRQGNFVETHQNVQHTVTYSAETKPKNITNFKECDLPPLSSVNFQLPASLSFEQDSSLQAKLEDPDMGFDGAPQIFNSTNIETGSRFAEVTPISIEPSLYNPQNYRPNNTLTTKSLQCPVASSKEYKPPPPLNSDPSPLSTFISPQSLEKNLSNTRNESSGICPDWKEQTPTTLEPSIPTSPNMTSDFNTSWRCRQCLKTFTQRVTLQMHVCPQQPDNPYQCGHCTCSFANPEQLRIHVETHVSDKPYRCGFCARTFAGATTLNNHMRTHTGSKPYSCKKCGKTFLKAAQLARHKRALPAECC